jgi:hypothetical protein
MLQKTVNKLSTRVWVLQHTADASCACTGDCTCRTELLEQSMTAELHDPKHDKVYWPKQVKLDTLTAGRP